ncbi:hypothetical protein KAU40_00590 [Candidatus Parcubacteria bacterium]|nr:hypothetical protein [Candidatus Parcubacteria bacterium]
MNKKFTILIIGILLLAITGGIFWWQSEKELKELNKNLPDGVKIEKKEGQYKVVNKRDGYEIKMPKEWEELYWVDYIFEKGMIGHVIVLEPFEKEGVGISCIIPDPPDVNLEIWIQDYCEKFFKNPLIERGKIGDFEITKLKKEYSIRGGKEKISKYLYVFRQNSKICQIGGESKDSIHYIILNSKWSL